MVSQRDYSEVIVEAARSVLLEVIRILGEYQDDIVVIGGWVPELLLINADEKHVGSIDVDLALNHQSINEVGYKPSGNIYWPMDMFRENNLLFSSGPWSLEIRK